MTPAELADRLGGRRSGTGWQAKCPTHDDVDPSLSIAEGDDGRILVKCHGGCATEAVVEAMHLHMADLMPPRTNPNGAAPRPARAPIVATYDYVGADGVLRYQVLRRSDKTFTQRRPDPDRPGKWLYNLTGVERCLYYADRLAKLPPGSTIFTVEGEKDADRLWADGQPATCNPGGAGKWRREYGELLRGHHVVVIPDNDPPGTAHADTVVDTTLGVAASVRLPGPVPEPGGKGADVSDFLDAGHSIDELRAWAMAVPTLDDTPAAPDASADGGGGDGARPRDGDGARPRDGDGVPPPPAVAGEPGHLTDYANSEHLVAQHGRDLRWTPHLGWLMWNSRHWARDEFREAQRRAKRTVRRMYATADAMAVQAEALAKAGGLAAAKTLQGRADALRAWATRSESRRGLEAMVELAASEAAVQVAADELDADPWLLTCANGTLDLRTGALGPHRREDLITKTIPVPYNPSAACPRWERFLGQIMGGNERLVAYLQRAVGYSLTGLTREQCLFFLYGLGSNGKTTMLEVLRALFGPYAQVLNFKALLTAWADRVPNDLAALAGARLVTAVEAGPGKTFDEVTLKQLTGQDPISARFFRQEWFTYVPAFKLWVAANSKPAIRGTDFAMWRRLRLIPFTVTFPDDQQDKELPAKLRAELPGIFGWAVRGCVAYTRDGLGTPSEVASATIEYREAMDVVGQFIAETCIVEPVAKVLVSGLYDQYVTWATVNHERPMEKVTFGVRLIERGFTSKRLGKGSRRWWLGLRLRSDPVQGEFAEPPDG